MASGRVKHSVRTTVTRCDQSGNRLHGGDDPRVYARLAAYGARVKDELNRWAAENEYPLLVNGRGSFLGYEVTDHPGRLYRSARDLVTYSSESDADIRVGDGEPRRTPAVSVVRLRCRSR